MNVGYIISSLSTGGAEVMLLRHLRHTERAPYVFHLGGSNDLDSDFEAAGATVIDLDIDSVVSLTALESARAELASYELDLLHAHLPSAMIVARLAGRAAGIDTVVSTHHNPSYPPSLRVLERVTRPLDAHEIAVSDGVRERQSSRLVRADWTTIPNGIPVAEFKTEVETAEPPPGFEGANPVFLNVGRYVREKRQVDLVDAMVRVREEFPDAAAAIVGYGPLKAKLEERVATKGLTDVVKITGQSEEVERYYALADAFVLPSASEGLPITGLEAMAASLPIIGTRIPGIEAVVEDGTTGRLVPPRSPHALAEAMVEVASGDTEAIGARAYERAQSCFSIERMVAANERVYEQYADA